MKPDLDRLTTKLNVIKAKQRLNSDELLLVRRLIQVLDDHESAL